MHDTATLMEIYVKTSFNSFFDEMNTSYNSFILTDHCNMEDIKSFCKNISSINIKLAFHLHSQDIFIIRLTQFFYI